MIKVEPKNAGQGTPPKSPAPPVKLGDCHGDQDPNRSLARIATALERLATNSETTVFVASQILKLLQGPRLKKMNLLFGTRN